MRTLKRWLAAALAAALLALTGCASRVPQTALAVDGEPITAELYLLYQYQAYVQAQIALAATGDTAENGTLEGLPATDWVHEKTLQAARRYVWVQRAFDEAGLAFSDAEQAAGEAAALADYNADQALLAANGVGEQTYALFYQTECKYKRLYSAYADKQMNAVSDEDAKAYMDATYAHIQAVTLPAVTDSYEALSADAQRQLEAAATALVQALREGGDFEPLARQTLQEAFALCGMDYTDEAAAGYYSNFFGTKDTTLYPAATVEQVWDAPVGYAGLYNSAAGLTVYQKTANYDDTDTTNPFAARRATVVRQLLKKQFDEMLAQEAADYKVVEDAYVMSVYTVDRVKSSV